MAPSKLWLGQHHLQHRSLGGRAHRAVYFVPEPQGEVQGGHGITTLIRSSKCLPRKCVCTVPSRPGSLTALSNRLYVKRLLLHSCDLIHHHGLQLPLSSLGPELLWGSSFQASVANLDCPHHLFVLQAGDGILNINCASYELVSRVPPL